MVPVGRPRLRHRLSHGRGHGPKEWNRCYHRGATDKEIQEYGRDPYWLLHLVENAFLNFNQWRQWRLGAPKDRFPVGATRREVQQREPHLYLAAMRKHIVLDDGIYVIKPVFVLSRSKMLLPA